MSILSVIIPIYNREKYLKETLDSISSQTFRDLEIICVNDGSIDDSVKIVEEFIKQDDRIKLVNKENGGQSSARNAGLAVANGKYVTFIDSDDLIDSNTFEIALKNIEKVDVVCYGIQVFGDSLLELRDGDNEYYRIKYNGIIKLNRKVLLNTDVSCCNKIFKMDILNKYNIRYPEGLRYEDANFYWKYMSVSKKACFIDKYFYHYRRHSNSIISETFGGSPYAIDHLHILKDFYEFLINNNLYSKNFKMFIKIFIEYTLFVYNYSLPENKIKSLDIAKEYAKEFFGKKNPTNFIKYLKKGKYSNLLEPDLTFLQKIFSIKKVYVLYSTEVYKKISILGINIRYKKVKKGENNA